MLRDEERAFEIIAGVLDEWLAARGADEAFVSRAARVLALDRAFCPRVGAGGPIEASFDFAADEVARDLGRMELPQLESFAERQTTLCIQHPGAVGEVLIDPDGGSWMRGKVAA